MSASPIEDMLTVFLTTAHTPEDARRAARDLLRRHARYLAEQIRNSEELRDATDDHMGDCNMAADLIDPEVQR